MTDDALRRLQAKAGRQADQLARQEATIRGLREDKAILLRDLRALRQAVENLLMKANPCQTNPQWTEAPTPLFDALAKQAHPRS